MDWLSRLFEMMPVRGRLDLPLLLWSAMAHRSGPGEANEIPYHAVVSGSALLEDPVGGKPLQLNAGDILLLPGNLQHVMHDRSGARPETGAKSPRAQSRHQRERRQGRALDLLCGHFTITPPHDRLLRDYLPPRLIVHAGSYAGQKATATQLAGLVSLYAERIDGRSLGWAGDVERAVDGDVRPCIAARQ